MITPRHKAFAYMVRQDHDTPHLLVSICHHELGYEVPKGGVEPGEHPEQAALREVFEETGITHARVITSVGITNWRDEIHHFFLIQAPDTLPDAFAYTVNSADEDDGLCYEYQWLEITPALHQLLVQGCDAGVEALLSHYGR